MVNLNYIQERTELSRQGGGLAIAVRSDIPAQVWTPNVKPTEQLIDKERQWLKIDTGGLKIGIVHIYMMSESGRRPQFKEFNKSLIDMIMAEVDELRKCGYKIMAIGDMNGHIGNEEEGGIKGNHPGININGQLIKNFASLGDFTIVNTMPLANGVFTREVYNASKKRFEKSVLDYALVEDDLQNQITSFTIDKDRKYSINSDHMLIQITLTLKENKTVLNWHRKHSKFYLNEETDYDKYKSLSPQENVFRIHLIPN